MSGLRRRVKPLVLLPRHVVQRTHKRRSERLPKETGGFLLGFRRDLHIEITGLTEQGPGDVATGDTFERRCPSHRERIHAAWRASGQFESLVGDWHSHPVGDGEPSGLDRSAWRTLVRTSRQQMIGLIAAEVQKPRLFLTPGSWLGSGRSRELSLVEESVDVLVFGET